MSDILSLLKSFVIIPLQKLLSLEEDLHLICNIQILDQVMALQ